MKSQASRTGALLRDLVLLARDRGLRAAPHVKDLTWRFARLIRDLALLACDQLLRAAKLVRDLTLLGWDQVLRAVPPGRRLIHRSADSARGRAVLAAPPARNLLRQARGQVRPVKYLAAVGVLLLVCVGVAQTSPGHLLLSNVGLYEQPASYTELTFASPSELTTSLKTPKSPVDVSFIIHNVTGSARAYHWSVVLTKDGASRVSKAGTAPVRSGGRVTIRKSLVTSCSSGRIQVSVRLASPAESVDFWVTCPAAKGGSK